MATRGIWLDGTDLGHDGSWTDGANRPVAFAAWGGGEPNNAGGNEHCLEAYTTDGTWNDAVCTNLDWILCAD